MGWTNHQRDKLAVLWSQSLTANEIAAIMNKSRNAVLGMRNRMGLPERGSPIIRLPNSQAERERKQRERQERAQLRRQKRVEARIEELKRAQERELKRQERAKMIQLALALVNPDAPPVPFAEIAGTHNRCHFPLNGGWCGRDTQGGSWCPHHRTIVFLRRISTDEQTNSPQAPAVAAE